LYFGGGQTGEKGECKNTDKKLGQLSRPTIGGAMGWAPSAPRKLMAAALPNVTARRTIEAGISERSL